MGSEKRSTHSRVLRSVLSRRRRCCAAGPSAGAAAPAAAAASAAWRLKTSLELWAEAAEEDDDETCWCAAATAVAAAGGAGSWDFRSKGDVGGVWSLLLRLMRRITWCEQNGTPVAAHGQRLAVGQLACTSQQTQRLQISSWARLRCSDLVQRTSLRVEQYLIALSTRLRPTCLLNRGGRRSV